MHLLIFSNEKKKISSKLKRRRNVFSTCLINSNDWSDLQRCILVCFRICGDKKISKAGVEEDIQEIRIKGDGLHREPRKNDISSIRSYPNHSVVFISFLSFCLFFRFFFFFFDHLYDVWRILPGRRAHDEEISVGLWLRGADIYRSSFTSCGFHWEGRCGTYNDVSHY